MSTSSREWVSRGIPSSRYEGDALRNAPLLRLVALGPTHLCCLALQLVPIGYFLGQHLMPPLRSAPPQVLGLDGLVTRPGRCALCLLLRRQSFGIDLEWLAKPPEIIAETIKRLVVPLIGCRIRAQAIRMQKPEPLPERDLVERCLAYIKVDQGFM